MSSPIEFAALADSVMDVLAFTFGSYARQSMDGCHLNASHPLLTKVATTECVTAFQSPHFIGKTRQELRRANRLMASTLVVVDPPEPTHAGFDRPNTPPLNGGKNRQFRPHALDQVVR